MAYQQILAIQNRNGGTALDSGWLPVPAGLTDVSARINISADGAANAFIDPAEAIVLEIWWRNAGAYGDYSTGPTRFVGRTGRTRPPAMGQGVPTPYPTHARATCVLLRLVAGEWVTAGAETVIRFGLSVEVT